jgi:oligogalacturonide lyase
MKHHRYSLEPKVHFSPDEKQVIFRANFEGTPMYAVEIEKAINNSIVSCRHQLG